MKILALQRESHVAKGAASLSVSARVTEVLEYMSNKELIDFISVSEFDPVVMNAVDWADIIIFSKHNSIKAIEIAKYARSVNTKIFYDIDDWIFSFPSYSAGSGQSEKIKNINEILKLTDCTTVANFNLLSKVGSLINNVHYVPNGMWVEKYSGINKIHNISAPRIVFTNADLIKLESAKEAVFTALQVFFTQYPHYVLDFYGDPFPEMSSLPWLHFTNRMPYDSYMKALVRGDYQFSISPLGGDEDTLSAEFNRCKNPFKYLNYGSAHVPGIYSSSEIYKNCIEHKVNGLLVDNTYESWLNALILMAEDAYLRNEMSDNAFDDVNENFHIKYSSETLMNLFKSTL